MDGRKELEAELMFLRSKVNDRLRELQDGGRWTVVAHEVLHDTTETQYWIAKYLDLDT